MIVWTRDKEDIFWGIAGSSFAGQSFMHHHYSSVGLAQSMVVCSQMSGLMLNALRALMSNTPNLSRIVSERRRFDSPEVRS